MTGPPYPMRVRRIMRTKSASATTIIAIVALVPSGVFVAPCAVIHAACG